MEQPQSDTAIDVQQAVRVARSLGFPVLARPSYVLGGRAMKIFDDEARLVEYMEEQAPNLSKDMPVLIDRFLESAQEVDVDCLCDGTRAIIGGVMQHIEEAGVHSGDSACVIPAHSLPTVVVEEIKRQTRELALKLEVRGLMNVQFAIAGYRSNGGSLTESRHIKTGIYILEANPRASRTVPFVSKAIGRPLAKLAALVMAGKTLDDLRVFDEITPKHFSVKESVFPFNKFPGVDIILGPEMRSTGEVMGIDDTFPMAFAKSQLAASAALPKVGTIYISVADRDKPEAVLIARGFSDLGYELMSTRGTAAVLRQNGIPVEEVMKLQEGRPNLLDHMTNGKVSMIVNTPSGRGSRPDEVRIRVESVARRVTCLTTLAAAEAAVDACRALRREELTVTALQDRFAS